MQVAKFLRLPGCAFALALATTPAIAADYTIDLSHSFIQFRISHLGYSVLNGRFNDFAGTLQWDKAKPAASNIALTIKTASIDSNWAERDKHIRSKDFLEVEKFPDASFKSTKFTGDATAGKLEGELTLHGVTKPVTLDVKAVGEGDDPWGGYRAGFTGTTTLKRGDFGINYNLGPSAETMQFDLFVEGIKKK
ncbi:MAG: YceI family protein [Gammaproteobacteria bacterium]|nr:YceI family protein [Gammaproteobacteria bacterium]